LRVTIPPKIARYNADQMRALLNCANERARMFNLMALNLAYYPVDICRLRFSHITDAEGNPYQSGDMFITRQREKTKHQNSFTTTHFVWPETQALMERHRAPENPTESYFLSAHGTPFT